MTTSAIKMFSPRVVANTGKKCTATAILLHGSGGTGDDMRDAFRILLREELSFPHIRFIYPTAPQRPYSLAGGLTSNVWFDRVDLGMEATEQKASVDMMAASLGKLIEEEVEKGVPLHRILIGGFSMGGAMALHLGFRLYPQVAGVLVMSSFLSKDSSVYKEWPKTSIADGLPPLQQYHGEEDDLVCYAWGKATHTRLRELGVKAEFVSLPNLTHSLNATMARSARAWIAQVLPEEESV